MNLITRPAEQRVAVQNIRQSILDSADALTSDSLVGPHFFGGQENSSHNGTGGSGQDVAAR